MLGPRAPLAPPPFQNEFPMKPVIVVIEDEPSVREVIVFHLRRAAFEVRPCATGQEGRDALLGADAVVLDWNLPDGSGLEWLERLRTEPSVAHLPVLMVTARASEAERVSGLYSGADDYLTKPFSAAELVARLHALLRRAAPRRRVLRVGAVEVDEDTGTVTSHGRALHLARREFELLAFLARHSGRVYARRELLDRVWGEDYVGTERTVDQHVARLRSQLDLQGGEPGEIETVHGRGYRMRGAVRESA